MKITKIKIAELNPAEYNPRRMTNKQYEDLKNSLEKFGCTIPIVINANKTIIGGHQRVRIMRELGAELVPAVRVNLSKEDETDINTILGSMDNISPGRIGATGSLAATLGIIGSPDED